MTTEGIEVEEEGKWNQGLSVEQRWEILNATVRHFEIKYFVDKTFLQRVNLFYKPESNLE